MPKPWEITGEEARQWGDRIRARREAADRIARPLFVAQIAANPAEEDERTSEGVREQPLTVALLKLVPKLDVRGHGQVVSIKAGVRHPEGGSSQMIALAADSGGRSGAAEGIRVRSVLGGQWEFVSADGGLLVTVTTATVPGGDLRLQVLDPMGILLHEVLSRIPAAASFFLKPEVCKSWLDHGGSLHLVAVSPQAGE